MTTIPPQNARFDRNRRRGFTILELLTTLGAIVLLVAVLIHAATAARRTADTASEMAAARSLGMGWSAYAADHRGAILPGYASGYRARDQDGEWIDTETEPVAALRWPLRLAPYLGHDFRALYSGPNAENLEGLAESPTASALYSVSVSPSFGLNSLYMGGDQNYGGHDPLFLETFGQFYSTRLSTIRHPERLVVFATSRGDAAAPGEASDIREGFFRVLPPAWATPLWGADFDLDSPQSVGFVSPRHASGGEDAAIVTSVDGAVSTATIEELRDMRRWSDRATDADWLLTP